MSQPYGGGQQPGGQYPGSGGFGQPGGHDPNSGGFPQAPGYGAMPPAPQEYSAGPIGRPGVVTAAAVLAFVQAGITTITTLLLWVGIGNAEGSAMALSVAVALAQTAGIVLLIWGGVQFMAGTGRTMLLAGAGLELAICLYYIVTAAVADAGGIELLENAKTGLIAIALGFAIMPVIIVVLALGNQSTQFLGSRRR